MFAELTVQRGVPHCSICGSGLIWLPGRAWCMEMARLPAPIEREFARLLPEDPLPPARDVVPWPVSETLESPSGSAPVLLECDACDRLHPPSFTGPCPCGAGSLHPVRRDLFPAISGALSVWAEVGASEGAQLFVPDRRRVPTLIHHLIAREASGVRPGELRLVRLPTMVADSDAELLSAGGCADALRASLVRASSRSRRPIHFSDRFRHEARRLRKLWQLARIVLDTMESDGVHVEIGYSVEHLNELPEEDRAFLSRFERVRTEVRALYEAIDLEGALDRLSGFMEQDLGTGYLPLARTRLLPSSSASVRAATCQVLARVVYLWVELFAPIAPFTSEAIGQAFRPDSPSLFERRLTPAGDALVDAEREKELDRWVEFAAALRSARRQVGLPADTILPRVVLLVGDDALADELQRVAPVLARVGRTGQIEIDSPNHAWAGRRI
ncbi:MAG: class I tRNA ligase family protein, partial [Thermoplasmata archaeon]